MEWLVDSRLVGEKVVANLNVICMHRSANLTVEIHLHIGSILSHTIDNYMTSSRHVRSVSL